MAPEAVSHVGLLLSLLVVGGVGGFLSGLLGVGGGIIFVPALYFTLTSFSPDTGHAMRIAIGTSLALVLVTGASSAFWHHKKGSVDFNIIKNWTPAVVLGVAAGTFFASAIDGHILKQFFASITLLISVYMTFSKEPPVEPPVHSVSLALQRVAAAIIGMIAAILGIGGAMLNIPFMTYMGVPMRKSVGTGGALAFIISLPAMVGYIFVGLRYTSQLPPYSLGYVNLLALVAILPISMLLSPVGVHVSHNMPRNILRRIFAVVLVVVALRMFIS